MSIELRIALLAITIIYAIVILKLIKKKEMNLYFNIFWIFSICILVFSIIFPNIIIKISKIIGFQTPVNMMFCFAIFVSFYLIFKLTLILSQEYKKNVSMIQEISILKIKIEKLEKNSINKKFD